MNLEQVAETRPESLCVGRGKNTTKTSDIQRAVVIVRG